MSFDLAGFAAGSLTGVYFLLDAFEMTTEEAVVDAAVEAADAADSQVEAAVLFSLLFMEARKVISGDSTFSFFSSVLSRCSSTPSESVSFSL